MNNCSNCKHWGKETKDIGWRVCDKITTSPDLVKDISDKIKPDGVFESKGFFSCTHHEIK